MVRLRAGRVSFTCSQRAVVRHRVAAYREDIPVPMIGKTRVDRQMHALVEILRQDPGTVVEGDSPARFKVIHGDRHCYLPAKYVGNSMDNEIRRQLRNIGVTMMGGGLPTPREAKSARIIEMGDVKEATSVADLFGFDVGDDMFDTFLGLVSCLRRDVKAHVDKAVNEAIDELGDAAVSTDDVVRLETQLQAAKEERARAVENLVGQRDAAREEARLLKERIGRIRGAMNQLGIQLPESVYA